MSNQQNRVILSIASPSEIERTARRLMAIRESFLTRGPLAVNAPRQLILESWQRCDTMHVNPARRFAPLAIAREAQLYNLREANELLIRATRSVMSHLTDFLAGSGYVIVLSDASGCLLDVLGDAAIRRRLARIDFIPGGNWSEAAAGTNAIGTALADGHVVQLMAAEHYCDGWQDLTCTAAPIRHPLTGKIIGILDVTGNYRLIRPFLTNTLAAAALEISQQLCVLLTSTHGNLRQLDLAAFTASFSDDTSIFMHNNIAGQHADKHVPDTLTITDMRDQLNQQERRAHEAERLAEAAGAISARLEHDVTIEKVAEHAAYLLQLECAMVCLFHEIDEDALSLHIWRKQKPKRLLHLPTLKALLVQTGVVSLVRERGELVVIDDLLTSTLLPIDLVEQIGIRSIAIFPLTAARGVIGFIALFNSTFYHWMAED